MFKKSKYGNRKITAPDGEEFDSMKEYNRWGQLKLLQRAGKISGLQRQVKFQLLPVQRDEHGKLISHARSYIADFVYFDDKGNRVVEDCKGYKTDIYQLKKAMMYYFHKIQIKES
jgi:hypothetical protein